MPYESKSWHNIISSDQGAGAIRNGWWQFNCLARMLGFENLKHPFTPGRGNYLDQPVWSQLLASEQSHIQHSRCSGGIEPIPPIRGHH
jgi:hypothetical protein